MVGDVRVPRYEARLPLLFRRPTNPLTYLAFWVPYIAVYQLTNRFPIREPQELAYSDVDKLIPFVPAMLPIYLLYFPLYWWTAIRSESDEAAVRLFYAAYFQLVVCAVFFVLFPVQMPEGLFYGAQNYGWADSAWRWFDGPNNCFPSLHAANGLLLLHFNWNRAYRWLHTLVALGVVFSTVLVKQHYAVDIVAGAAVYLLTLLFLSRLTLERRD